MCSVWTTVFFFHLICIAMVGYDEGFVPHFSGSSDHFIEFASPSRIICRASGW